MSVITDMVLIADGSDWEAVNRLNGWCEAVDPDRRQLFCPLDTRNAGGSKAFTDSVWAMAGNFFPWWDLVELLPTFGWRYPENVVLTIRHEGEELQVVRIGEEVSYAIAPDPAR